MALVTIVMPVYNGAVHIRAAIDSILQQTLRDFDLFIMDDGSTDDTVATLKAYADADKRISLILRQHQGQIACRNELLKLATTEFVACADADDICLPDRLGRQLAAMTEDEDLWILGTSAISIDKKGRRRRRWQVPTGSVAVASELERRCCIVHPSCMMRVSRILSIGGYRPAYECAEDYDLFLRASEYGKVDNLGMVGVLYRQHDGNVSHRRSLQQAISTDLARATYLLRVAGGTDPTDGLAQAPGVDDPLLAQLLSPARMELYRAIAIALDPAADAAELDQAARVFHKAKVDKKRARISQRAIIRLLCRRPFDRITFKLVARAAALGPGRLVRLLLALCRHR